MLQPGRIVESYSQAEAKVEAKDLFKNFSLAFEGDQEGDLRFWADELLVLVAADITCSSYQMRRALDNIFKFFVFFSKTCIYFSAASRGSATAQL